MGYCMDFKLTRTHETHVVGRKRFKYPDLRILFLKMRRQQMLPTRQHTPVERRRQRSPTSANDRLTVRSNRRRYAVEQQFLHGEEAPHLSS